MSTLAGVHFQNCTDGSCSGCYPAPPARPKAVRTPGPKRDAEGLSVDQRRTKTNRESIERGIHPATGAPLAGNDRTCGGCVHAVNIHYHNFKGWKCELHRLGMSHSAASDIRVGWPACKKFEEAP